MDARRRQPSASVSVKSEDVKSHARRLSHSATPLDDEDGEGGRRSTRGRNPLPPTKGPLFPPLPPKQPKPRSTSIRLAPPSPNPNPTSKTSPDKSSVAIPIDPALEGADGQPPKLGASAAASGSRASSPANGGNEAGPSGSAASLTPPPPTSEDARGDMDADPQAAAEGDDATSGLSGTDEGRAEGNEDWEEGKHAQASADALIVKREEIADQEGEEDDRTPRKAESRTNGDGQGDGDRASPPPIDRTDSGKLNRKRRGEEQLLLDDHLLPAEMRRTGSLNGKRGKGKDEEDEEGEAEEEGQDEEDAPEDITRCVCKLEDEDIMMIQCDDCNVWQHGPCMGIWADEEAPEEYYCELCRPDLHGPLRKWVRSKGRNATYIPPPTPAELQKLHHHSDKHPPSQSKRWTDPALMDPPPAPTKPPVRSHHRKEAASPVESTDGKRSASNAARKPPPNRERAQPPPPPPPEKPESKKKVPEGAGRRGVTVASPSPSRSPPPNSAAAAALKKRRSTMNSRYDDEVYAVMEASRMESTGAPEGEEELAADPEEAALEEKLAPRKGKRKREDDEGAASDAGTPVPSSGKPKHPNQYTYRPKPVSATQAVASPMRRVPQSSTPVPTLPPPPPAQHDHGTRRAGAIANGTIPPPPNSYTVNNLHWHLPEHLSLFSDILPTPDPIPLEPRLSRSMAYLPRNHFINQKYGPFNEDRDASGKLILPDDLGPRETNGDPQTQLEPPARVRYPSKRVTTAEIRKRVRNMLEYVSRVQQEESKRKQRAELVGIDIKRLPGTTRKGKENEAVQTDEMMLGDEHAQLSMRYGEGVSSEVLMDELMRDLIGFQESMASGVNGDLGVSPMPPTMAMFTSAPNTPVPPSASTFATAETFVPTTDGSDAPEEDTVMADASGSASDQVDSAPIEEQSGAAVAEQEALAAPHDGPAGLFEKGTFDIPAGDPNASGASITTAPAPTDSIDKATSSEQPLAHSGIDDKTFDDLVHAGIDAGLTDGMSGDVQGQGADASDTDVNGKNDFGTNGDVNGNGGAGGDDAGMDLDLPEQPEVDAGEEAVKGLLVPPDQSESLDRTAATGEAVKDTTAAGHETGQELVHDDEGQDIPIDPALLAEAGDEVLAGSQANASVNGGADDVGLAVGDGAKGTIPDTRDIVDGGHVDQTISEPVPAEAVAEQVAA